MRNPWIGSKTRDYLCGNLRKFYEYNSQHGVRVIEHKKDQERVRKEQETNDRAQVILQDRLYEITDPQIGRSDLDNQFYELEYLSAEYFPFTSQFYEQESPKLSAITELERQGLEQTLFLAFQQGMRSAKLYLEANGYKSSQRKFNYQLVDLKNYFMSQSIPDIKLFEDIMYSIFGEYRKQYSFSVLLTQELVFYLIKSYFDFGYKLIISNYQIQSTQTKKSE